MAPRRVSGGAQEYGKFGANPHNYRSYGIVPIESKDECEADITLTLGRNMGPWSWSGYLGRHALMEGADPVSGEANTVESQYYNVATAASITGFVRAYLLRHIAKVQQGGGRVFYCDTDSLVFSGVDAARVFGLSKKLGDWSHEGRFDRGAIAGKKLYAFHPEDGGKWKTATKGVRIDAEAICRVAAGETVTWEAEAPLFTMHRRTEGGPKFMSRKVRMT